MCSSSNRSDLRFFSLFQKYAGPYPYVESFSLIHDPRNDYNQTYGVDRLGNIWSGRKVSSLVPITRRRVLLFLTRSSSLSQVLYVNAEIDRLKDAVVKSIKNNQA